MNSKLISSMIVAATMVAGVTVGSAAYAGGEDGVTVAGLEWQAANGAANVPAPQWYAANPAQRMQLSHEYDGETTTGEAELDAVRLRFRIAGV